MRRIASFWDWVWVFARGMFMGTADTVPGVSGGTVALITGLYERLIAALRSVSVAFVQELPRGHFKHFFRTIHWDVLLTIGLGVVAAILAWSRAIDYLLNHEPQYSYVFAAFFGLVLGSIWFCLRLFSRWTRGAVAGIVAGAVLGYLLSVVGTTATLPLERYEVPLSLASLPEIAEVERASNYNLATETLEDVGPMQLAELQQDGIITPTTQVYSVLERKEGEAGSFVDGSIAGGVRLTVLGGGAVAAAALLVPGISGAMILRMLGFYRPAIANVTDWTSALGQGEWDGSAFAYIVTLGVGILLGLLICAPIIGVLLRHYHSATLATLIGFMVGALRSVWPFWQTHYWLNPMRMHRGLELQLIRPIWPSSFDLHVFVSIVVALCALFFVLLMNRVANARG